MSKRLAAACAFLTLGAVASHARADLEVDGRWRQSALREDYTVQEWLPATCGPTPQSTSTGGGEIVSMRMEGDELTIVGGGRVYRSNSCYDPLPNLQRESHSRDPNGKTWRTRCTTPANDARKALLNTLVVATTDTHIDLIETGRYEMTLESGRCMADVKRTRSYDLVSNDVPAATATTPPPPAKTAKPEPRPPQCDTPGEPSRLEVRPSRKILRTGETFAFKAIVVDDKGCPTRTTTTWKVAPGADAKGVTVGPSGEVTIAKDAPEGTVDLVATAAGKDARVTIEITEPAHYDDLLARSGLDSKGENDTASVAAIGGEAVGAGESRVEDRSKTRRMVFIGIVGGALALLGALAVVFLRRSRRAAALAREAEERHDARVQEVLERRRIRAEQHAAQLRAHEESLASARAAGSDPPPAPRAPMICPTCGRESPAGASAFCANDGTSLVPISDASSTIPVPAALPRALASKRGKICPTCGERFDGAASFCGKDGTQLVLIN